MKTPKTKHRKISRAWIIIPGAIVVAAVIGLLISSFQKEAGIAEPANWGRAAVAATLEVDRALAAGSDAAAYDDFSAALLVALVAHKNMAIVNPADTRLDNLLTRTLDCFTAVREAWQAELDHAWDPQLHGHLEYWHSLHPFLEVTTDAELAPAEVRRLCAAQAEEFLQRAVDFAD